MVGEPGSIGLISWDYAPPRGGLGRAMQVLVQALQERGRSVAVLAGGDVIPRSFRAASRIGGSHILAPLFLHSRLKALVRENGVSTLLAPCGPGGVFLPAMSDIPLIAIVYHTYLQQAESVPGQQWKKIFVPRERRMLLQSSRVLCYAEDTHRVLIDRYGLDPRKVILLPQIIDLDPWRSKAKESGLCVCVARLEARKGVEILLRAWPSVIAHVPHAHLCIVGDGVLRNQVDERIGHVPSVRRFPALAVDDLRDVVSRAEVAICPSFLEGFGLAAVEAMAAGTALAATDVDGLRTLIRHRETGMLSPPGNPDALASSLIELLVNADLRQSITAAAEQDVRRRFDRTLAINAHLQAIGGN